MATVAPTNRWTKLPGGSILIVRCQQQPRASPAAGSNDDDLDRFRQRPRSLQNGTDQISGSGVLLPDGRVFQIGASSNTALYTPSATPGGTGTWAAGPVLPNGLIGGQSGLIAGNAGNLYGSCAAAMMSNGHVLFVAAHSTQVSDPYHVFEFDPTAPIDTSLTDVSPTLSRGSLGPACKCSCFPADKF